MTLKDYFNNGDKFATGNGILITKLQEDCVQAVMTVEKWHMNAPGFCQGGALFTLCDYAFGALVNAAKKASVTLNATIHYHNAAKLGDILTAEARFTNPHRKVPCGEVIITNQDGLRIASFYAQGYTKDITLEADSLE